MNGSLGDQYAQNAHSQASQLQAIVANRRPTIMIECGTSGYIVRFQNEYALGLSAFHGVSAWDEVMALLAAFPTIANLGEARE